MTQTSFFDRNTMKQKGFAPIIILVLVVFAIAGYFIYQNYSMPKGVVLGPFTQTTPSPTTDPAINWKTYTDSKLGFSIKYPQDKFVVVSNLGDSFGLNRGKLNGITIDFQILYRGPTTDPQTALKRETPTCTPQELSYSSNCTAKTEIFQINNASGLVVTSHTGFDAYLTDLTKSMSVLRITIDTDKNDPDYHTFMQILSTFKFLGTQKTNNVLEITKTLTPGVNWSNEQQGTIIDFNGKEISGTLIKTSDTSPKISEILSGASNAPLVTTYGWTEEQSADGVEGSIDSLSKIENGVKDRLIIRYSRNTGTTVLLYSIAI